MRSVYLEYNLTNHLIFRFDEPGDITLLIINDVDKTMDGNAVEAALTELKAKGINLQLDVSKAWDKVSQLDSYRNDECRLAKSQREYKETS